MISRTKQNWNIGETVKVGFLSLRVVGCRAVKDSLPDIYQLTSLDGRKLYEFIPHNGLQNVQSFTRGENLLAH